MVAASTAFERVIINCTAPGTCFEKTEQGGAWMKRFDVKSWPYVLFLDPSGEVVERVRGGCGRERYLELMEPLARRYAPDRRLLELTAEGDPIRTLARTAAGGGTAGKEARAELQRLRDAAAAALAVGQSGSPAR